MYKSHDAAGENDLPGQSAENRPVHRGVVFTIIALALLMMSVDFNDRRDGFACLAAWIAHVDKLGGVDDDGLFGRVCLDAADQWQAQRAVRPAKGIHRLGRCLHRCIAVLWVDQQYLRPDRLARLTGGRRRGVHTLRNRHRRQALW